MTSLQDDLQNIKTSINKPILKKEPAPCRRVTRATNRELNQISTNQNVQSSVDADVKQEYESSEPTPSAILLKGYVVSLNDDSNIFIRFSKDQ